MATKELIVSDIDGEAPAQRHVFSLDGVDYEIDLTEGQHADLVGDLDPYVSKARAVGGGRSRQRRPRGEASKIRKWAQAQGHTLGLRGRIPNEVVEAYRAAH